MKPWSAFYPYILIHLPGCPQPVIDQALLLASIEFFTDSMAWKEKLDPVKAIAGILEYDFEIDPKQQEIVQLCTATLDGEDLPVASPGADEQGIYTRDRLTFWLTQPADVGASIQAEVTLKPCLAATGIPDALFSHHARAIAWGAAGDLMTMAGQPFSNPALSMDFRARFAKAKQDAQHDAARSFARPRLRVKKSSL